MPHNIFFLFFSCVQIYCPDKYLKPKMSKYEYLLFYLLFQALSSQQRPFQKFSSIKAVPAPSSTAVMVPAYSVSKAGTYMIKGRPCIVNDISTPKTGKHGHAKVGLHLLLVPCRCEK